MKPLKDIPGDAQASAQAHARYIFKYGEQLIAFDHVMEGLWEDDIRVKSFKVRVAQYEGEETLVIVTADVGETPSVGYHSADGFAESVRGMIARLKNRTVVWKKDKYAEVDG